MGKIAASHSHPSANFGALAPTTSNEAKFAPAFLDAKAITFLKVETDSHHNHSHENHAHLDDEAHARAHAATLPGYVNSGQRPSLRQIMLFGAAGGMTPCPASITVMLLALSTGRTGLGIFAVLGFSLGLALALVSVGMAIVMGLSQLSDTGRLAWASKKAPIVSASLVILSGLFALLIAH